MIHPLKAITVPVTDMRCVIWWPQGQELEALRAATPYQHIVYCGDGANDLCPALALASTDTVLARKVDFNRCLLWHACLVTMTQIRMICTKRHVDKCTQGSSAHTQLLSSLLPCEVLL